MSETETWQGVLKPTGKTITEAMKDVEIPDYYDKNDPDDLKELFFINFYKKKVLIDGFVYDVEKENLQHEDIFKATKQPDGSFTFLVQYYNGGCSFDEAIEEAVNKCKQ